MAIQIQLRRDTAANWTSNDPTLAEGEIGTETDTGKFKIGDGATAWTALAYSALGDVTAAVALTDETLVQGDGGAKGVKTSTATVAQVAAAVVHYGDATGADHSDIVTAVGLNTAKDTNVTTNITVVEAPTNVEIQSSDGSNDTIAAADVTNAGVMTTTMYDEHVVNTAHALDNTQAHTDYLLNSAEDTGVGLILTQDNSSADTQYTAQVLYNTDATPPAASGFPIGTLYVQYTA